MERRWNDILSRSETFAFGGLEARWLEHEDHSSDSAYAAMAAPRQFTAPPPYGASCRRRVSVEVE